MDIECCSHIMLLRHSSIYLFAKLIPGLMAFAALSIYSHLLEPEEYGIYTLIITGTTLLHNTLYQWLASGTLRFWNNQKYSKSSFISTIGITYAKISFLVLLFIIPVIIIYADQKESSWIINSYLFLQALALFTITQNLFMAKLNPLQYAFMTISYSLLALSLATFFVYHGYGVSGIMLGVTLGLFIPSIYFYKKTWRKFDRKAINKPLLRKLIIYGLPLASSYLLEEITKLTDRFMVAYLLNKSEAGYYGLASELTGSSIFMIMTAINMAAYPVIIKLLDTDGKDAAIRQFRFYVIALIGVSLPAVIGLNLVGPDIIYLIISEKYQHSVVLLLPWVSGAMFMLGLQAFYFDLAFQLGQKVSYIVKISIVISILNISLNYLIIPLLGVKGAAIATIISFSCSSIASLYYGKKVFPLPIPYIEFLKIIISSLVMGFSLWCLKDFRGWAWLALQLTTGIVSYFIMIWYFNLLDIRTKIRSLIMKIV